MGVASSLHLLSFLFAEGVIFLFWSLRRHGDSVGVLHPLRSSFSCPQKGKVR